MVIAKLYNLWFFLIPNILYLYCSILFFIYLSVSGINKFNNFIFGKTIMKAFVTGATGFLGLTLIKLLLKQNWEVIAFHRERSNLSELKKLDVSFAVGDVTDLASIERSIPEGVDCIFHTAGSVGFMSPGFHQQQYDTNVLGAKNIVTAALKKKVCRIIYTSTVLTYDYLTGRVDENSTFVGDKSKINYIKTKALGDLEMVAGLKQGLDIVFMHPGAIFGAYDTSTWSMMFKEIDRGVNIPGGPPGKASCAHMSKVAEAHLSAFYKGKKSEHYLLGGADSSLTNIVTQIGKILDLPVPDKPMSKFFFSFVGYISYALSTIFKFETFFNPDLINILCKEVMCDSQKAVRDLNYDPSSLNEMLLDCHQWMVKENMLSDRTQL